jgi:hypothetical protein
VIILDSGHWVKCENIAHEGICRCERPACVGRKNRVYCYFEAVLSPWVIKKGCVFLYSAHFGSLFRPTSKLLKPECIVATMTKHDLNWRPLS